MERYTLRQFMTEFPDDVACLEWLKNHRWADGIYCEKCGRVTKHHLVISRKSFSCQECGHHVHPTANTIFHKSSTSLTQWFYAVFLMASTRCGISAKQVERELGVTYKTAWRMCKLIRDRLADDSDPFSGDNGDVEADETYIGGPRHGGKRGRGADNKTVVFGMAQRQGGVKVTVVPDAKRKTVMPLLENSVEKGTRVHTDEFMIYDNLPEKGYKHERIMHGLKVYVNGDVHTNTIEGFWALVKTGIVGVFHGVSAKYLQNYLNEYAFRYNHRKDDSPMFRSFMNCVGARVL